MPTVSATRASDQVKRPRHQARSSDTQPPSSHRSTHTAEHPMLPPIRTRTSFAEPPQPHWTGASPFTRPTHRSSTSSVPDDIFWATIEQLGGRDVVLARLVADTHCRESATAASLPPVLSLESSQPIAPAGHESARAPDPPHHASHAHAVGRPPDGASSGGEESMDMGDGDAAAQPRACGTASRYAAVGRCLFVQNTHNVMCCPGVHWVHMMLASASDHTLHQLPETASGVR